MKSFKEFNKEVEEDFDRNRAGNINAKISNRKDISPEDKDAARKSLSRKTNTAKRKEGDTNILSNSGKRYNVGTKRPTRSNDPKHADLEQGNRISKTLKGYKASGGG